LFAAGKEDTVNYDGAQLAEEGKKRYCCLSYMLAGNEHYLFLIRLGRKTMSYGNKYLLEGNKIVFVEDDWSR
jgi:hypothetical protein